ncbi:unnamed protein product [Gongylonema pulchrum]|uniref:NADH-quinone oxidoreductase subunit H n=1 Tax=Gongylonema pulchrum TaxID=637853 RepID=A0A183EAG2_9BILA|nr:unnamed protein product [Gongylonema pulchrum]
MSALGRDVRQAMVEYTPMIIFVVIFVAVPIQFLLSPSSTSDVRYHLHKFVLHCRPVGTMCV